MKRHTVVSVEQALSMTYCTLRMVQLGWRVIKLEAAGAAGTRRGDPNRYVGREVAGEDRHAYFVAPNAGKESLALDLKRPEGRELLGRLIEKLDVDVFCTNTLPAHHAGLGIDYPSLSQKRPGLVWCCISAQGLDRPQVPGYDPVIQAGVGYMDLTGHAEGPPLLCGVPLIDLKAGDEAFLQVALALWERETSGKGRQIDVSMARAAASWLQTFLPLLDLGSTPDELRRSGNQHRQFFPVNAYPTADGYLYLAVGNDGQWRRLCEQQTFSALARPEWSSNEGRRRGGPELHAAMENITRTLGTAELAGIMQRAGIPHSPIATIEKVFEKEDFQGKFLSTTVPGGKKVRLPPAAVEVEHLGASGGELPFCPAYGEHTRSLLGEIGLEPEEIESLYREGVVA